MGGKNSAELLKKISEDPNSHEKEIKELFDKVDANHNGKLDYTEAEQFFDDLFKYLESLHPGVVDNQQKYIQHWMRLADVDRKKEFTKAEFEHILKHALERPTLFELKQADGKNVYAHRTNGCLLKRDDWLFGAEPCPDPSKQSMIDFINSLVGTWKGAYDEGEAVIVMVRPAPGNVRNKGYIPNQCLQVLEYSHTFTDKKGNFVSREVGMFLFEEENDLVTRHGVFHNGATFLMKGKFWPNRKNDHHLSKISAPLVANLIKNGETFSLCDFYQEGGETLNIALDRNVWKASSHCQGLVIDSGKLLWSQTLLHHTVHYELTKQ